MLQLYLRSGSSRSWSHTNLRMLDFSFPDTIISHCGGFFLAAAGPQTQQEVTSTQHHAHMLIFFKSSPL